MTVKERIANCDKGSWPEPEHSSKIIYSLGSMFTLGVQFSAWALVWEYIWKTRGISDLSFSGSTPSVPVTWSPPGGDALLRTGSMGMENTGALHRPSQLPVRGPFKTLSRCSSPKLLYSWTEEPSAESLSPASDPRTHSPASPALPALACPQPSPESSEPPPRRKVPSTWSLMFSRH